MVNRDRGFTIIELIFVVVIFLIMTAVLAPFVRMAHQRAHIVNCGNNLRKISLGLHEYAADHNGSFPVSLSELYPDYVGDEKTFNCPANKTVGTKQKPNYVYTTGLNESSPLKTVIVQDQDGNHKKRGKNILRINGSVEQVR